VKRKSNTIKERFVISTENYKVHATDITGCENYLFYFIRNLPMITSNLVIN